MQLLWLWLTNRSQSLHSDCKTGRIVTVSKTRPTLHSYVKLLISPHINTQRALAAEPTGQGGQRAHFLLQMGKP